MFFIATIRRKLVLFLSVFILSSQALADCNEACVLERNSCQQTSSQQQGQRCDERFSVCTLSCKRQETMSCVFLGFKNHEGEADREKELKDVTNGFARVTDEKSQNFAGLCRTNNMKCEYVLGWAGTMYSCGGVKREPGRVACCR